MRNGRPTPGEALFTPCGAGYDPCKPSAAKCLGVQSYDLLEKEK